MISIYHNIRCSKSRDAVRVLEERYIPYTVRLYLQDPLTKAELRALLKQLGMQPSALLRRNEALFKELNQTAHTEAAWLDLMVRHPQLIERPIAVHGDRAVVARPPERVLDVV